MIGWLNNWLIDWVSDWLIEYLIDWVIEWLIAKLSPSFARGRQQNSAADLSGKRHTGFLHQKGTFQFQRRFCALCGTRFLCCKSERSLKVILEVDVREYEVVHQERKEGKTSSYPHELRFSCPGKETHLFYTESRQAAEEWVKASDWLIHLFTHSPIQFFTHSFIYIFI